MMGRLRVIECVIGGRGENCRLDDVFVRVDVVTDKNAAWQEKLGG